MLCTAGQTGCLPWLAVVCMYHRRRSCRIVYGRHHVIVCVQSCVCSEGEHTLHIAAASVGDVRVVSACCTRVWRHSLPWTMISGVVCASRPFLP